MSGYSRDKVLDMLDEPLMSESEDVDSGDVKTNSCVQNSRGLYFAIFTEMMSSGTS